MIRFCTIALLVGAFGGVASANSTVTLRDKAQAACYGDVQRLCGTFMPDEDKITDCMSTKRSKVSPECSRYYDLLK